MSWLCYGLAGMNVEKLTIVNDTIARTSEWVITLWRSCELFLSRDMQDDWNIPTKNNEHAWSPQMITTILFLFLFCITINWMFILKFNEHF